MLRYLYKLLFCKVEKETPCIWYVRYSLTKHDKCTVINKISDNTLFVLNTVFIETDRGYLFVYVSAENKEEAERAAYREVISFVRHPDNRERINALLTKRVPDAPSYLSQSSLRLPVADSSGSISAGTVATPSRTVVRSERSTMEHRPTSPGDLLQLIGVGEQSGLYISPDGVTWQRVATVNDPSQQVAAAPSHPASSNTVFNGPQAGYRSGPGAQGPIGAQGLQRGIGNSATKEKKPKKPRKEEIEPEPKFIRGLVVYKNAKA